MTKLLLLVGLSVMMVCGAGCVVIDVEKVCLSSPASSEIQGVTTREVDEIVCMSVHPDESLLR